MAISEALRRQLIILSRRSRSRSVKFTAQAPTDWRPQDVLDPTSDLLNDVFSDQTAWRLIADYLEAGGDVMEVTLSKPPGAKAYVMLIEIQSSERPVYVKLQLGAGEIFGRSFHYSERN